MFFFSSRRRHTRYWRDWSSDVCSSDLFTVGQRKGLKIAAREPLHDVQRLARGDLETFALADREMNNAVVTPKHPSREIGRASCRERGQISGDRAPRKEKRKRNEDRDTQ